MATTIAMPRQGQSVETCVIQQWRKVPGDAVAKGDIIFTYETDKASFEFESPVEGTLLETYFDAGVDVPVLTTVAVIGAHNENTEQFRPGPGAAAAGRPNAKTDAAATAQALLAENVLASAKPMQGQGRGGVSPRARKIAGAKSVRPEGLNGSGPHGRIIERDVLAAAGASRLTRAAAARFLAEGLAAPQSGSGMGGRFRSEDLVPAPAEQANTHSALTQASGGFTDIPLTKIRKIIAQRMHLSLQSSAQLTMSASANATGLLLYREFVKKNRDSLGLENITVTDLVSFATVRTLMAHPALNAWMLGEAVRQFDHVHLAIAVDTPRGLMVPVVRDADMLSLNNLAKQMKALSRQCREGSINPDLLTGGTITLSNLGMYGIESFTPVLNLPQVALMGVNNLIPRPTLAQGDTYTVAQHIGLSLTIDHRAVDGGPAAKFLKAVCMAIEGIDSSLTTR